MSAVRGPEFVYQKFLIVPFMSPPPAAFVFPIPVFYGNAVRAAVQNDFKVIAGAGEDKVEWIDIEF